LHGGNNMGMIVNHKIVNGNGDTVGMIARETEGMGMLEVISDHVNKRNQQRLGLKLIF